MFLNSYSKSLSDPYAVPVCIAPKEYVGNIKLPASKSILNRILVLAALSSQSVCIEAEDYGEDTSLMLQALIALGFEVYTYNDRLIIKGLGGHIPHSTAVIECGNAGTVARFISAMVCLRQEGTYTLRGTPAMYKRPMQSLFKSLESIGALEVEYLEKEGHLPCILKTKGIPASTFLKIEATQTSQGISALMLIGWLKGLTIDIQGDTIPSWPFVEMTQSLLGELGIISHVQKNKIHIHASSIYFNKNNYIVPADLTAASYFACWVIVTRRTLVLEKIPLYTHQSDFKFLELLASLNFIHITLKNNKCYIQPNNGPSLYSIKENFNPISDTFLSLAAISPLLHIPIEFSGIGHTRLQESDRIQAAFSNLLTLGQSTQQTLDTLSILPNKKALKANTLIHTHKDHRLAMSFAILGSYDLNTTQHPWLWIQNPLCCQKTFPRFFDTLQKINHGQ